MTYYILISKPQIQYINTIWSNPSNKPKYTQLYYNNLISTIVYYSGISYIYIYILGWLFSEKLSNFLLILTYELFTFLHFYSI